ncbi:hypothetical protein [Nocardioides dongkuii]|uniref:hypothetical protein n=1 Tax=Nocardioides dongkuii TaxID=2760089 RepID=UPI001878D3FB|nr:hypothetical protein [Nocardioides dongkuii]
MAARFDLSDLPAAFREQLHSLQVGDEILLVEGGKEVGAVVALPRVLVGQVIPAAVSCPDPQVNSRPGVKVVATGMKVDERVRAYLSAALGDDFTVVDIRTAPETIDVLLVPPLSGQALGILRAEFPSARLIVTELDDPESDTWIAGPVTRAMAAGADAYLVPGTVAGLAAEVRVIVEGRDDRALSSGSHRKRAVLQLETDA